MVGRDPPKIVQFCPIIPLVVLALGAPRLSVSLRDELEHVGPVLLPDVQLVLHGSNALPLFIPVLQELGPRLMLGEVVGVGESSLDCASGTNVQSSPP